MGIQQFAVKVRRREGVFYKGLYQLAIGVRHVACPVVGPLHRALYYERRFRKTAWHYLRRVFYWEPLFKSICREVGPRFRLVGGIPWVEGNLDIRIGSDVTINGITTLAGATVWEAPALVIGDHSYIGYQVTMTVGPRIEIGRHVLVADRVSLVGYDGHPKDPVERRNHRPAPREEGRPIVIGDNVWICSNATILKGVTVGEGAIIAAHAVVTSDVAPYTVVAGNPARLVKKLSNEK
ncbi:MAG: acyltransferase [Candidatus Manganitrophaceae bacterium]|nr:MAG: acyltransferase [Candidatus Manganitrophaceae bacterium]